MKKLSKSQVKKIRAEFDQYPGLKALAVSGHISTLKSLSRVIGYGENYEVVQKNLHQILHNND